jgi:hypothetical protein
MKLFYCPWFPLSKYNINNMEVSRDVEVVLILLSDWLSDEKICQSAALPAQSRSHNETSCSSRIYTTRKSVRKTRSRQKFSVTRVNAAR